MAPWAVADTVRTRHRRPYVTYSLIAINAVVYLASLAVPYQTVFELGLVPKAPNPWAFVTSLFLHASVIHLTGNMLLLWLLGKDVEDALGHFWYAVVYTTGGVAANVVQISAVLLFLPGKELWPVLGASGCVAAISGVFAMRFRYVRIRLQLPFSSNPKAAPHGVEIPSWPLWAGVLTAQVGVALWELVQSPTYGAPWAHMGGFVYGMAASQAFARGRGGRNEQLVARARMAAAHGELWKALEMYQTAVHAMGEEPELLVEAGEVQERLGDKQAAADLHVRALEALLTAGRASDAIPVAARLSRLGMLQSLMPSLRFRVASIMEEQGRYAEAVSVLRSIAEGQPSSEEHPLALYRMGRLLQRQPGRKEEAAAAYRKLIAGFPESPWAAPARDELQRLGG